MFTSRTIAYGLIVGVLSISAIPAHADFWSKAKDTVTQALPPPPPPPPKLTLHPDKPLTPATLEVHLPGGASATVTPGPVPAPPVVQAPGNGFLADVVNKTNEMVQKPKKWIDQKGEEINRGFIHLGNEIGMVWANFKSDLERKGKEIATNFFNWLKEQAEKYGIYALAGVGALFLVRGFFGWLFGRRHSSRTKFAGYHA